MIPENVLKQRCFYFGTFNPIHFGHLLLAETALRQFGFEEICFIPAGSPPHRQGDVDMASALDRLNMVRLAIADHPFFTVSEIETIKDGPSYTIDTLLSLFPDALSTGIGIPLIIGADALLQLGTWHQAEQLAQIAWFLQANRPSFPLVDWVQLPEASEKTPLHTTLLENPEIGISSTAIRQRVREGKGIRYYVPEVVRAYIQANALYP